MRRQMHRGNQGESMQFDLMGLRQSMGILVPPSQPELNDRINDLMNKVDTAINSPHDSAQHITIDRDKLQNTYSIDSHLQQPFTDPNQNVQTTVQQYLDQDVNPYEQKVQQTSYDVQQNMISQIQELQEAQQQQNNVIQYLQQQFQRKDNEIIQLNKQINDFTTEVTAVKQEHVTKVTPNFEKIMQCLERYGGDLISLVHRIEQLEHKVAQQDETIQSLREQNKISHNFQSQPQFLNVMQRPMSAPYPQITTNTNGMPQQLYQAQQQQYTQQNVESAVASLISESPPKKASNLILRPKQQQNIEIINQTQQNDIASSPGHNLENTAVRTLQTEIQNVVGQAQQNNQNQIEAQQKLPSNINSLQNPNPIYESQTSPKQTAQQVSTSDCSAKLTQAELQLIASIQQNSAPGVNATGSNVNDNSEHNVKKGQLDDVQNDDETPDNMDGAYPHNVNNEISISAANSQLLNSTRSKWNKQHDEVIPAKLDGSGFIHTPTVRRGSTGKSLINSAKIQNSTLVSKYGNKTQGNAVNSSKIQNSTRNNISQSRIEDFAFDVDVDNGGSEEAIRKSQRFLQRSAVRAQTARDEGKKAMMNSQVQNQQKLIQQLTKQRKQQEIEQLKERQNQSYMSFLDEINEKPLYFPKLTHDNSVLIKQIINNSVLKGDANKMRRQEVISAMGSIQGHYLIILKDNERKNYHSLVRIEQDGSIQKVSGPDSMPQVLRQSLLDQFFKYNTTNKQLSQVQTNSVTQMVVAATLALKKKKAQ